MYINVISAYRNVVAIADKELIGKTFEEDLKMLDIKESFYKGDIISENEMIELILFHKKEDATFNIVGERSTQLALRLGIISEDSIGNIAGIPYAMTFL